MAEIRHLENRHDIIFFCRGLSDLDKILQTGTEWHVACCDMVEIETRCRIPIWQTFGRIQQHIIPQPPATLQGAATWRIQCHDPRATCHIAECCNRANSMARDSRAMYNTAWCCHLVNSLSLFKSHMPHCRVQSPGDSVSWSCHTARGKNSICHTENGFSLYFIHFFKNAVWVLMSGSFRIVFDTLVWNCTFKVPTENYTSCSWQYLRDFVFCPKILLHNLLQYSFTKSYYTLCVAKHRILGPVYSVLKQF